MLCITKVMLHFCGVHCQRFNSNLPKLCECVVDCLSFPD